MISMTEYQERAKDTAIYPDKHSVVYPALGLAGEVGETLNLLKKYLRGDYGEQIPHEVKIKIADELGDVLWYIANLANDLGLSLEVIAESNLYKLSERKRTGTLQNHK